MKYSSHYKLKLPKIFAPANQHRSPGIEQKMRLLYSVFLLLYTTVLGDRKIKLRNSNASLNALVNQPSYKPFRVNEVFLLESTWAEPHTFLLRGDNNRQLGVLSGFVKVNWSSKQTGQRFACLFGSIGDGFDVCFEWNEKACDSESRWIRVHCMSKIQSVSTNRP